MSKSQRLNGILNRAKGKEKKYEWLEAAKLYEQALGATREKDLLRKGEFQERIGTCFYSSAFQAEIQEEFKKRLGSAVKTYGKAAELYERLEDPKKHARINLCKGIASYYKSWLAESHSERKTSLDECWKLEKEALKIYEETGDKLGYGKACNELLLCLYDRSWFARDSQEIRNIAEEATRYGEKAIEALSEAGEKGELARVHYMLTLHYDKKRDAYESIEKKKEIDEKSLIYAQKALEISERTEDPYLISMSNWAIGIVAMSVKGDLESSLRHVEKTSELGTRTKDKLMIARARGLLAYVIWWKTHVEENPEERRKGYLKASKYAEDAVTYYHQVSYPPCGGAYWPHIESHFYLANDATNLDDKRVLLKKAIEIGRRDLEQIKRIGSPEMIGAVLHSLSKSLYYFSLIETKIDEKRKLLEEASKYREETINMEERSSLFSYWNRGVLYNYSALIKAELTKLETNNQQKTDLLIKAIADMENCLKLCEIALKARPQTIFWGHIGTYKSLFGGILEQLYSLTGEKKHVERAIEVYEDVVQTWGKADLHSRAAETYWTIAELQDHLEKHAQAARNFESASERYQLAAEKIPQLKTFYTEHAVYMQAWKEIEQAKHHHVQSQYGKAKEYYQKAADLHESTVRWNYLTPNYSAWAQLEAAEDLSRREQTEAARDLFQQAADLFIEAEKAVQTKLETLEAGDEKEMTGRLVKASQLRREYCLGRIALEEAIILDRQGDHGASSKAYEVAAEIFHKIAETESEQNRKELQPIIYLCKAWQKMMLAEAKASSTMYRAAAELFEQAKEHALDQPTSRLSLAHSSFCKALEAGTEFEITRDMTMYSTAKKHMEAAASHYLRAGFKNASEYARGTHRLFDAYMYMHNAETETDPKKKTQFYQMAERLLQSSAGSYMKAKHPEKSGEVKKLLESVKEERQLAMSLTEVLHAPTITSTTASFSTPTPTHEQAVGLERFEHADIQANLILRVTEVKVGEDVEFRVELVNAGKAPALLIKVDEILPVGFEIAKMPEVFTVEDSYINLKGKRLNPLKTEDVKMVVKPRSKGTFTVKPRILYIDETGKYRSYEPEPATITVKELGITGWIKGEK